MNCKLCTQKAIIDSPSYCKKHFLKYVEQTAKQTIKKYDLLKRSDKVCVAVSGGKDSITLLYILKQLKYDVEALAIDEGIKNYRDETLAFLKRFCKKHKIKLIIKSFEKEVGKRLDKIVKTGNPACTICGTFRRSLLNKYTKNYDKIATGHNLDDEAQAVLMNLLKAQKSLYDRQGPKTGKRKGFTQKIKPLYFLKEKEIMIYSILMNFDVPFTECPYAKDSFRAYVRDELNLLETQKPGTKKNILLKYLKNKSAEKNKLELSFCPLCGEPCAEEICNSCRIRKTLGLIA
ncbi:TIGR00269 family protein [Candidatus Woesearchaeota archaeon CG10_big_fil_rev_8_21_14_0_10_32_9]|nr:MAG: TIGR00269 family protein [Candidatus Woesearchaeota archaeon CG10_big_fil_rev_8_21_14_0_10_32_9]